jgi:adenylate cyclase, class 2
MREIEIKTRIPDKAGLLGRLTKEGIEVSEPVTQHDQVFGPPEAHGGDRGAWLRLRTETKKGVVTRTFTLKKSITNQLDSIEHETEVADGDELLKIIEHIGFTPYSELTKTRQKAHFGDIELCIDTVEGLGDFVEAEKLTDEDADYVSVSEELWAVLEHLGAKRDDHVTDGYDVLMRKTQGLE